ncbi:MAG: hypothetical protein PQJ59_04950 [Spirochaetales bacterium]|nr:hypothetical protein [Spirochaetales bacterium]
MSSNNRSRRWNKNKKNANRGNRDKNKKGDNRPPKKPRPHILLKPLVREVADCSICGEPIKDITSALSLQGEGIPAHFDCVLAQVRERETHEEGEIIIYLGQGDFGVVNEEDYQKGKLTIVRKFPYEHPENREDWRKKMRQDVDFQKK